VSGNVLAGIEIKEFSVLQVLLISLHKVDLSRLYYRGEV
jgi:hypothetical protein